jgi:hypothetical protein
MDEPARTVPAALFVGVGEAVEEAPEPEAADLEALAVIIPVDVAVAEGATTIPPAAVAGMRALEVAFPEDLRSSFASKTLKVSLPPPT